jgi:hypothetical protein
MAATAAGPYAQDKAARMLLHCIALVGWLLRLPRRIEIKRVRRRFAGFCRVSVNVAPAMFGERSDGKLQEDKHARGLGRDAAASHPDS